MAWINFVALVFFVGLQPILGALSDRIGRRPLLIAFGVSATLATVPLLTVAIFGGTTEYIALGLKNIGHESWFFFYVSGAALISLLVYLFMGESSSRSYLERESRSGRQPR